MTEGDRHTTPRRLISVGDDLWKPLGVLVGERGRSDIIRQLLAWYLRVPGARLPERPATRPKVD